MNARERFIATLKFQKIDRPFRWEAPAVWPATIKKWKNEGLPEDITCSNIKDSAVYDYFEMDKLAWLPFEGGWIGDPFYPMFEKTILDSDEEHQVLIDTDGIMKRIKTDDPDTSMPQFLKFPVETREDYMEKILPRYDYKSPERFPEDWNKLCAEYKSRDYPLGMFIVGPFGHLRNLMGDEGLMFALYDDPEFIHYIMTNWKNFYLGFVDTVCKDVVPDFVMIWEDMCYKSGPLISPDLYKEFMAPCLAEIISLTKLKGIEGIIVDNDGNCTKMLPIYLDCGANAFYPFEVQAGMDIIDVRNEYGNRFTIIGGLDKKALSIGKEAIRDEIDEKVPVMLSHGGYIPMIDHSVPTNISLEMFRYFLSYVREKKA